MIKRPEKYSSLHTFEDYGGFQMLVAAKISHNTMSVFQGNPTNIINKFARSRDHEVRGYCQAHFTDLIQLHGCLQDDNYLTWFPVILALVESEV